MISTLKHLLRLSGQSSNQVISRPCMSFAFQSQGWDTDISSAKGVRKNLIARGQDEATIKANRTEIDEIVRLSTRVG